MVITKFITKTCILPQMEAKNKSDALKELSHLLFEKRHMKGVGPALEQMMAREINESTGIGHGLGLPHTRVSGLKSLVCAIGRTPDGLDFMALDRKPVQLIFMICYPPTEQTTYLNFVATVTRLLKDGDNFQALLNAKDEDEIFNILDAASEHFTNEHVEQVRKLRADPAIEQVRDAHADLILLARLQMYEEMLASAKTGKTQIKQRIEAIRGLVEPRILKHYDRLMKSRPPALVSVEGDTCQGCFMKLPSRFAQQVRQDGDHIHTCNNCSRFIYIV